MILDLGHGVTITGTPRGVYMSMIDHLTPPEELAVDLEVFRRWALTEVQRLRGEARMAHIPNLPGQQLVYADKLRQAQEYLKAKSGSLAEYPALFGAEAKVRELSAEAMAQLIITKAAQWQAACDKIEAMALQTEDKVQRAATVDDIISALVEMAQE